MDDLRVLTLHNMQNINGTLPTFIGDMQELQLLSLFNTDMTGTIPTELGRLDKLRNVFLHNADFTGTMPAEICAMRNLEEGDGNVLVALTADCSLGPNGEPPKVVCDPLCCTGCF
jgi:hypothetical protein